MIEINVNMKSVSGKKNRIKTTKILYNEQIKTVRELIEETVQFCVKDYNERREKSEILTFFSDEAIEDKASLGKVSFGVNYGEKNADLNNAVENALEAFSDGIVVIFADNNKLENLDETINIAKIDTLTFLKLTMLAGRLW